MSIADRNRARIENLLASRRAGDIVGDRVNRVLRAAALQITSDVVRESPVDTGRFRANWNVSVNEVDGSFEDLGDDRRAYSALQTAKGAENRDTATKADLFEGDVVYIANGLPYAERLNNGWSRQAPAKFVDAAVERMNAWLPKTVAQIRVTSGG